MALVPRCLFLCLNAFTCPAAFANQFRLCRLAFAGTHSKLHFCGIVSSVRAPLALERMAFLPGVPLTNLSPQEQDMKQFFKQFVQEESGQDLIEIGRAHV